MTRLFKLRDSSTEAKQPAEQHDGSLSLARASCTDSTSEGNPSLTSEGNPSLSSSDGKVSGSLVMGLSSQAGCEILKVSSDAVLLCIILRLVDSCCVCRCLIILDSKRFANMVCRKKRFLVQRYVAIIYSPIKNTKQNQTANYYYNCQP